MRRKRGSGSVVFHNGIWELNYRSDGKRIVRSLGKGSRLEAEARASVLLEALPVLGITRAKIKSCGVPLKDVWTKFIRKPKDRAAKTVEGYESNWQVFLEWAATQGLKSTLDLQPEHVDSFYAALRLRKVNNLLISEDTARRILKVSRRILKVAGCPSWGELPLNSKAASKGKREGFSDTELQAVQKALSDDSIECTFKDELAVLHQIGLHTGLRLGDCCLMRWASIDLERKLLTVKPRKTANYDRSISIPIVSELESALKNAARWNDSNDFVLPNIAGRYGHNPCGVQKDYEYILQKAGIQTSIERPGMKAVPFKTFHSLRHTFISRLAEKGVSPLVIQSMSGHTTMAMTERYSHIGLDAKRRALEEKAEPGKETQPPEESSTKKKLNAVKMLLESKKDRTPLEEALLALL